MAESTLTIGINITIKPPRLSTCDTNTNDQFSCTEKQTKIFNDLLNATPWVFISCSECPVQACGSRGDSVKVWF